jgi:hypothetical protein
VTCRKRVSNCSSDNSFVRWVNGDGDIFGSARMR